MSAMLAVHEGAMQDILGALADQTTEGGRRVAEGGGPRSPEKLRLALEAHFDSLLASTPRFRRRGTRASSSSLTPSAALPSAPMQQLSVPPLPRTMVAASAGAAALTAGRAKHGQQPTRAALQTPPTARRGGSVVQQAL